MDSQLHLLGLSRPKFVQEDFYHQFVPLYLWPLLPRDRDAAVRGRSLACDGMFVPAPPEVSILLLLRLCVSWWLLWLTTARCAALLCSVFSLAISLESFFIITSQLPFGCTCFNLESGVFSVYLFHWKWWLFPFPFLPSEWLLEVKWGNLEQSSPHWWI